MSDCEIKECNICNMKNVLRINKSLRLEMFINKQYLNLHDELLPELKHIIIDYTCELTKVYFVRSDFIGDYVGWTSNKTLKLLENNRDKIIIINDTHSLIGSENDYFGREAINTIKNFIVQNKDIVIIFN